MNRDQQLAEQDDAIYTRYLKVFEELWGLPHDTSRKAGAMGNELFEAEFSIFGPKTYNQSVIMPLRNACQNHWIMPYRQVTFFDHNPLLTPILDYGCGVGYQLVWLKQQGYDPSQLWGYDVPGPQELVTRHIFAKEGINFGIPKTPRTILCFHVLEHLEDPFATIDYLRSLGGKLYASCVSDKGHGHLVDEAKAADVIAYLREEDEYVEDYKEEV